MQSAYLNGYYNKMVDFLRSIFSSALKTNDALEKGIMTGYLRISKDGGSCAAQSIYSRFNNFKVYSILDHRNSICFGFTSDEVTQMLADHNFSENFDEVKM